MLGEQVQGLFLLFPARSTSSRKLCSLSELVSSFAPNIFNSNILGINPQT